MALAISSGVPIRLVEMCASTKFDLFPGLPPPVCCRHIPPRGRAAEVIGMQVADQNAQVSGELSTASGPVVWGDREDHFLRIGQVLDAAGQEGLGHGDRVQRLPQELDLAVLGHETASK